MRGKWYPSTCRTLRVWERIRWDGCVWDAMREPHRYDSSLITRRIVSLIRLL